MKEKEHDKHGIFYLSVVFVYIFFWIQHQYNCRGSEKFESERKNQVVFKKYFSFIIPSLSRSYGLLHSTRHNYTSVGRAYVYGNWKIKKPSTIHSYILKRKTLNLSQHTFQDGVVVVFRIFFFRFLRKWEEKRIRRRRRRKIN